MFLVYSFQSSSSRENIPSRVPVPGRRQVGKESSNRGVDSILMRSIEEESSLVEKAVVRISISVSSIHIWCSCVSAMVGALLLVWWMLRHRQTNTQLWMVPFSLVLLATPAVVWFSVFASGVGRSDPHHSGLAILPNDSVHDPEK